MLNPDQASYISMLHIPQSHSFICIMTSLKPMCTLFLFFNVRVCQSVPRKPRCVCAPFNLPKLFKTSEIRFSVDNSTDIAGRLFLTTNRVNSHSMVVLFSGFHGFACKHCQVNDSMTTRYSAPPLRSSSTHLCLLYAAPLWCNIVSLCRSELKRGSPKYPQSRAAGSLLPS